MPGINSKNAGILIQARIGSNRLPKKIIIPFYKGKSILELLAERIINATDNKIPIILSTTINPDDNKLVKIAEEYNIKCFRGSENDVLNRFVLTAEKFHIDTIIRVCADNPLFDIVNTLKLLDYFKSSDFDYISYQIMGNVPSIKSHLGFWGEVVSLQALKRVTTETNQGFYREHVTNYIYSFPDKFTISFKDAPEIAYNRTDIRLTVDTFEDFILLQEIYNKLSEQDNGFDIERIISLIDHNPQFLERMKKQIELNQK